MALGNHEMLRWRKAPLFGILAVSALVSMTIWAQPSQLISPGECEYGQFGYSVSGIPDVNGDSRADVVVGAYNEDPGSTGLCPGRAYLFDGATRNLLQALSSPNEETHGRFGCSVSGIPDVNGDSRGDVVVGAEYEHWGHPSGTGRAYIFDGATGTVIHTFISPSHDPWQISGHFGCSVSGIPDVNGDGRGDVVVGASFEGPDFSPEWAGRAYVFDGATGSLLHSLTSIGEEYHGHFGYSVSGVPDVNGDGFGDVIVGAHQESPGASPYNAGRAYIFNGASGNLLRVLTSPNEEMNGRFGCSVSGIPDLNDDGLGDVIVGAYQEDPGSSPDDAGRAYVFHGSSGDLLHTLYSPNEEIQGYFGRSVSGVPNVNGDDLGDVIVGAYQDTPGSGPSAAGCVYLFDGASGSPLLTIASPNGDAGGSFGYSVSGIPDVDGNDLGDVIVGAKGENPGSSPSDAGRAYIFQVDLKGDLDLDGDYNLFDILRLVDLVLDNPPPPTAHEQWAGDMDGDGDWDLFDILALVDKVLA